MAGHRSKGYMKDCIEESPSSTAMLRDTDPCRGLCCPWVHGVADAQAYNTYDPKAAELARRLLADDYGCRTKCTSMGFSRRATGRMQVWRIGERHLGATSCLGAQGGLCHGLCTCRAGSQSKN